MVSFFFFPSLIAVVICPVCLHRAAATSSFGVEPGYRVWLFLCSLCGWLLPGESCVSGYFFSSFIAARVVRERDKVTDGGLGARGCMGMGVDVGVGVGEVTTGPWPILDPMRV